MQFARDEAATQPSDAGKKYQGIDKDMESSLIGEKAVSKAPVEMSPSIKDDHLIPSSATPGRLQ